MGGLQAGFVDGCVMMECAYVCVCVCVRLCMRMCEDCLCIHLCMLACGNHCQMLEEKGVKFHLSSGVKEFLGDDNDSVRTLYTSGLCLL